MSVYFKRNTASEGLTGCKAAPRPQEVHTSLGLKVGLHTPPILGGNSYLSCFFMTAGARSSTHRNQQRDISHSINRRPIRKCLPNNANVYATIQSHGLSARSNAVRNGLGRPVIGGHQCRLSVLRDGNVTCHCHLFYTCHMSNLRKGYFPGYVPCHCRMSLSLMSQVDFRKCHVALSI